VRVLFLTVSICLMLIVYLLRLVHLQVFQFEIWSERSENNHLSTRVLEVKRGTIFDRNGAELALSVENYTVNLFLREVKSLKDTANILSTVLPLTREEILQKVKGRRGSVPIYKNLERQQAIKLLELKLPGVELEEKYRRIYPQNHMASNLIGFCGADGHGLEGLELSFDQTMRGNPGLAAQEDISFTEGGTPRKRILKPPSGGSNIYLTIDSFIQHLLETELAKLVEKWKPIDATAIVMDPFTGEVLGMACIPNYNLNAYADSTPDSHRNRPLVDVYEPGSCMKIFAAGAGLRNQKLGPDTRFYCRGYSELYGKRIKCHGSHGLVDMPKAMAESCNSAMIQISQILEPRHLYKTYRDLGFGEPSGLEVPAESQGIFTPPSRWSGLSAGSMCIGQEIAVTGIQLTNAYAVIANGGWLMKPHLIKRIVSQNGDIDEQIAPERRRQVFSPQIAAYLRGLLFGGVEFGTGKLAAIPDYSLSGKTSTAQKANPRGGYYSEKVVTSFIGLAPAVNPRIVLLVAANEPKGEEKVLFGGKVAAPFFGAIADRTLKYLKVPPDRKRTEPLTASGTVATDSSQAVSYSTFLAPILAADFARPFPMPQPARLSDEIATVVPDLRGRTLKETTDLVSRLGVQVQIEGSGIVIDQNPAPGSLLRKNPLLTVKMATSIP
jgi:cell division protein FtsI/penicillin-binding protein 2